MKRHFLTITDVNEKELRSLLADAAAHKRRGAAGPKPLDGKVVALVFQKPSMRTRMAFEVAVIHLGGSVTYLGQEDIQLGAREPIKDVARVLSRYVDAVVLRTFAHANVEEFARYSTVPVINGLSDLFHPCQALADLQTMQEAFGKLAGLRVAYIGDGNNVFHSLAQGCCMVGAHLTVATPKNYRPDASVWNDVESLAASRRCAVKWEEDPKRAVKGADVIYTDVWVSMGQEAERQARLEAFKPYQVNRALLAAASPGCRVLHCLPAHRNEEITDEVIESPQSLVFDQAENRLHVQKALLVFLLAGKNRSGSVRRATIRVRR